MLVHQRVANCNKLPEATRFITFQNEASKVPWLVTLGTLGTLTMAVSAGPPRRRSDLTVASRNIMRISWEYHGNIMGIKFLSFFAS